MIQFNFMKIMKMIFLSMKYWMVVIQIRVPRVAQILLNLFFNIHQNLITALAEIMNASIVK